MTTPPRTLTMREALEQIDRMVGGEVYEMVDEMRRIARAALAAEESGWREIDTAPNEFHDRGVFVTGREARIGQTSIFLDAEWPVFLHYDTRAAAKSWLKVLGVTHWRPAFPPPPPAAKEPR